MTPRAGAARVALASLVLLIALCVTWELWLAPLRPQGSWLVLKALPLVLALPGVARRDLYTLQWASMLVLCYLAEGTVRATSDRGASATLGAIETLLALVFFASCLTFVAPFKRAARVRRDATRDRGERHGP